MSESERIAAHRERRYDFVKRYKENNPCTDCGKFYPHYVMDLDHVRGKKFKPLSKLTTYSEGRIIEEMSM